MKVCLIQQCPICLSDWRFVWFYSVQYIWVISDLSQDLSQKYWACTHVRLISSQEREIVILAYDDSAMLSVLWVSCRLLITGTLGVYWCRTYLTRVISRESSHLKKERVNPDWVIVMLSNSGSVVLWWIRLFVNGRSCIAHWGTVPNGSLPAIEKLCEWMRSDQGHFCTGNV